MQSQMHPRFKKRIPCEFDVGSRHHIGVVLNVSHGGLFVSSRVAPAIGSEVRLDLEPEARSDAIPLRARVVWKRKVHRSLMKAGEGGIGLEIEETNPAYERWLERISGVSVNASVATEPEPEPVARDLFPFQVRLALAGTPRTRSLQVEATDEDAARSDAVARCGEGWAVLAIKR